MARYLIDSQVFLWASESPAKLLKSERALLSDSRFDIALSAASIWELSIKATIDRLVIPGRKAPIPPNHFTHSAAAMNIPILPIDAAEAEYVRQLPLIHGDPFDRILIAQALLGGYTVVTRDAIFERYPGVRVFGG